VFYAASESLAPVGAKQRLVEASGDQTCKSEIFDLVRGRDWPPGPWQLRTLSNRFSDRWRNDVDGLRRSLAERRRDYQAAWEAGDFDTAAVIAGEAADLVRGVLPAGQIVKSIVEESRRLLAGGH
jgi:nitronate monooxygenase